MNGALDVRYVRRLGHLKSFATSSIRAVSLAGWRTSQTVRDCRFQRGSLAAAGRSSPGLVAPSV